LEGYGHVGWDVFTEGNEVLVVSLPTKHRSMGKMQMHYYRTFFDNFSKVSQEIN